MIEQRGNRLLSLSATQLLDTLYKLLILHITIRSCCLTHHVNTYMKPGISVATFTSKPLLRQIKM